VSSGHQEQYSAGARWWNNSDRLAQKGDQWRKAIAAERFFPGEDGRRLGRDTARVDLTSKLTPSTSCK
jgi:hypothetical protein